MKKNTPDTRNLILALIISTLILGCWQYFVELPRKKIQAEAMREQHRIEQVAEIKKEESVGKMLPRADLIRESPRLLVSSDHLHGSVALKGLRFDDITLARYRETLDPKSPEVLLFSPAYDKSGYFGEFGWLAPAGSAIMVPDKDTLWTSDSDELTPGKPVKLTWRNPQGMEFTAVLELDKKYMFTLTQSVKDAGGNPVALQTYGYLNRVLDLKTQPLTLVHEGPLAVYDGILKSLPYSKISGGKKEVMTAQAGGWVGISDKYWFASILPQQKLFTSRIFSYISGDGRERFQIDYSATEPAKESKLHFFVGAKEMNELDAYALQYNIPLFDRAVDFGMFYFLAKPIFQTLTFFHSLVGNFGIAILLLTIVVKLLMYPLADKSYKSMAQMSIIRPKMLEIQERYKDDKMKLNQEMIELYKREKVNPASGCLPILLQIPVFISLYNALYATIEMRHAPFYGWIRDLSDYDPTNIFTLFGLLQWSPPALLHVGIWPLLMAITMYIQQQQSPPPPDPTQAKILKYMPLMFLFMFSSVASGLVIYWTWSNVLSILQQWHIKRRYAHLKK